MQKFVITGGPCTGKTTIIKEIEKIGLPVMHEVATEVINNELNRAKKNPNHKPLLPQTDLKDFQLKILEKQLRKERKIKANVVFYDRSIVDTLAYLIHGKYNLNHLFDHHIKSAGYTKIFFLEQLPFYLTDEVRKESPECAKAIHDCILQTYKSYKFDIITVPAMDIEKRVEFILRNSIKK